MCSEGEGEEEGRGGEGSTRLRKVCLAERTNGERMTMAEGKRLESRVGRFETPNSDGSSSLQNSIHGMRRHVT